MLLVVLLVWCRPPCGLPSPCCCCCCWGRRARVALSLLELNIECFGRGGGEGGVTMGKRGDGSFVFFAGEDGFCFVR